MTAPQFGFSVTPGASIPLGAEMRDAEALGYSRDYVRSRFMFCGTPDEVETQISAAIGAGATNFDGAIDADLDEHRRRITEWARLVLPRFGGEPRT